MAELHRPLRIPPGVSLTRFDPPTASAGDPGRWIITFELPEALPVGAPLRLHLHGGRHNKGRFEDAQLKAVLSTGEPLRVVYEEGPKAGVAVVSLTVGTALPAGERIRVTLNGRAPTFTLTDKFICLFLPEEEASEDVLPGANHLKYRRLLAAATVEVVGSVLDRLRVYAPSQVEPGRPFTILARPEDRYANVSSEKLGTLRVFMEGGLLRYDATRPAWGNCVRLEGLVVSAPGTVCLEVRDESHGLCGMSNPINVRKGDPDDTHPYWGMIHGHTELSDGAGTIDHYFTYARDACALDFCAPGDHDHLFETSDEMFRDMLQAVNRYHEDGRYVVFPGYEWAKWRRNGDGDRCVYFLRDEQAELLRSDSGHMDTPPKLFDALKGRDAIVIPHHTVAGNPCDFKDHDPACERLIEIYGNCGCSERAAIDGHPYPPYEESADGFVQRALAMGWRVGFTGGGDDHYGHPGDEIRNMDSGYKSGLFAVWAKEKTREGIWEALMARRCWATSGARILVRFSLNGSPMGSEVSVGRDADLLSCRRLNVEIHGTAPIEKAEIVRNNETIYAVSGEPDVEFEFADVGPLSDALLPPAPFNPRPFAFYYLRVMQEDGEMAWASPVWVEEEEPRTRRVQKFIQGVS